MMRNKGKHGSSPMQIQRIAAFTQNGAGGNPAGVVLADMLPNAETMQCIAAEVGYSETAFAAPSGEFWQARYVSPETEVPFCGHATIALGAALADEKGPGRYRLSLRDGQIEVEAFIDNGKAHATLRSLPTSNRFAPDALVEQALALFGYAVGSLDAALPPRLMNAGAEHLLLALNTREQLGAMRYDLEKGRIFMRRHGLVTVALVWREAENLFHVRNAFASGGVLEDPATGAAAAAFAGLLRDQGILPQGELTILQGADMGRPSRIVVRCDPVSGSPVWVSGEAALIA
jgi:PhzF family phenazine biosynthesis protein